MGINFFALALIVISLIITSLEVKQKQKKIQYKNIPVVTFNDSTYYDIDEQRVNKVISSSEALNYKNRDELYDATIILRNDFNKTDTISAEYIYNKEQMYKLYQNVNIRLKRDSNTTLNSDYVEFDTKNNIIQNNKDFELSYNDSLILGNSLYFDAKRKIVKSKNTHFLLKQTIKDKNEVNTSNITKY